jgi:hypothetical protein
MVQVIEQAVGQVVGQVGLGPDHIRVKFPLDRVRRVATSGQQGWTSRRYARPYGTRILG